MSFNGGCAYSGFVAHLRNTELRESTAFIVSVELVELGRGPTLFLKVVYYTNTAHRNGLNKEQSGPCILGLLSKCWDLKGLCQIAPPDNLPFSLTDQNFKNNLDWCPLITVTIIARTKVKPTEELSSTPFFSLAESKVNQAQGLRTISVNPTA